MHGAAKVVLVTGAQQGIGRATALAFAEAGADVGVNWLDNVAAAEEVAELVRAKGRRCVTVQANVARQSQVAAMLKAMEVELGPIDVLVNNAAVFPRVPFLEMSFVLDVNLKGSFFCAQAAAKSMIAGGRPGSI